MRSKMARFSVTVFLATALFLFVGCGQKTETPVEEAKVLPVAVDTAKVQSISAKTVITGKVTPVSEVIIVPKLGGKVIQVPVDVGTRVKAGQLLVKIDSTDLEISLSKAANGLQNAKLSHNQAVLNYNNAKANYDRYKALFSDGAISQRDLEQAQLAYELARETMNMPAQATAQNDIANIKNQIANTTIVSPIDGEVAARNIDPGELAGPTQPVITVVNIDKVYVEGTVAESDIARVKEGQEVTVTIEAAGGKFAGVVKSISPVANAQSRGYPVKIEIANSDHKLKPGMFAELQLVTQNKDNTLVIPKESLVTRGSDRILYVIKGETVEERTVQTGIESDDKIEITQGLTVGEQYVTEGQQSLYDQAKITLRTADTSK
ncbi:MAG: efflux RND transporter periplasmic adaptor subunit [Thermincola sp.]|nr:efflux RND transporter periplasmic adaptor subunit [Thermincola sp.]MDT3703430.1 efflux RND transporter periplasmic adaptor subunit [Thermincola sp.]